MTHLNNHNTKVVEFKDPVSKLGSCPEAQEQKFTDTDRQRQTDRNIRREGKWEGMREDAADSQQSLTGGDSDEGLCLCPW